MNQTAPLHADEFDRFLKSMVAKYIGRPPYKRHLQHPARVIARVMTAGTYSDVCELVDLAGETYLKTVMAQAEPGWFTPRSWAYWQKYLGIAAAWHVVPRRAARRVVFRGRLHNVRKPANIARHR